MILDRTHRAWALFTLAATLAAGLGYLLAFHSGLFTPALHETRGGTPLGLAYGIIAFLIFVFAALLGWRRKHPSWRLGRMQVWLKGHIWLTVLCIPLVFLHAGFRFGGFQTSLLMWTFLVVMLSGFIGLGLQHILPRLMKDRLPDEVVFEQIPFLRAQLATRAREILTTLEEALNPPPPAPEPEPAAAAEASNPKSAAPQTAAAPPSSLHDGLRSTILPYLELENGRRHALNDETAAEDLFMGLRVQSDPHWHSLLDELAGLVTQRRRMDLQTVFQHWLHGWILLHAPLSFLLLLLTLWHIAIALWGY